MRHLLFLLVSLAGGLPMSSSCRPQCVWRWSRARQGPADWCDTVVLCLRFKL